MPDGFFSQVPLAAWVAVSDEDSAEFLQSQFSQDLRGGVGQAAYGLWLDHRGKIHGDSTVLQVETERFLLASTDTPAPDLLAKLESCIVADEVVLEALPLPGHLVVGGAGAVLSAFLATDLPETGRFLSEKGLYVWRGADFDGPTWEIVGEISALTPLVKALTEAEVPELEAAAYAARRLASGIPAVPTEVGAADTPLEANLMTRAVSLTKGCFLGQEVVARTARLGRAAKQLRRVSGSGGLPADLPLPIPVYQGDNVAGELRALTSDGTGSVGLAMVKKRFLESAEASLQVRHNGNHELVISHE